MHGDGTIAFRRDLAVAERAGAERIWPVAADIRATISMIGAAGVLASAGRMGHRSYAACIHDAACRLEVARTRLFGVEKSLPGVDSLAGAAADLKHALDSLSLQGWESTDSRLMSILLQVYRASREMGAGLWALELRPEGLVLLPEARERFDEVGPGANG